MRSDRFLVGSLVVVGLLIFATGVSAYPKSDAEAVAVASQKVGQDYTQMIYGKPYKIIPGDKPGTFNVSWGDESMVWEPKPWHPKSLKEQGPAVYDRWIQPDLPYPWETTLAQREKQDGREIHDRAYTALYFNEFGKNYIDIWAIDLTSPDGTPRNKELFEWLVAYRRDPTGLPPDQVGEVRCKYMFTFVAPDDYRGLGINTTIFFGDRFNEEFLYTPSSRKVRRLPQAARQDIIPGTIGHWEDFPQVKPFPDIDYRVIGTTLYKGQPDGTYGYSQKTKSEQVNIGLDGVGEPAWIYEMTPHSSSYWYAKQRRICGMKVGSCWYEDLWDSKGELTRTRANRRSIAKDDPRLRNPRDSLEDWQMMWGGEYLSETKTGFTMSWYITDFWIDYEGMPRDIVNVDNLVKEPVRKILFWE
ncbi:MAG: hypothetical protein AB7V27_09715 [Candidatus Binatia bacterium]